MRPRIRLCTCTPVTSTARPRAPIGLRREVVKPPHSQRNDLALGRGLGDEGGRAAARNRARRRAAGLLITTTAGTTPPTPTHQAGSAQQRGPHKHRE